MPLQGTDPLPDPPRPDAGGCQWDSGKGTPFSFRNGYGPGCRCDDPLPKGGRFPRGIPRMRMLRFPPFPPAIADLASRRRTASRGDLCGVHPERACRGGCGAAGADPEVVPPSGWNLGGVDGRKGGFSGENGIVSAGGPAGRGPGDAGKTVNGGAEGGTRPPEARRSRHRPLRRVPGLPPSARSGSSSLFARRPGTVRVPGVGYGCEMNRGDGAEGGTRTPTWLPTLDPESSASANSATSAPGCGTTKYSKGPRPGKRENAFPGARSATKLERRIEALGATPYL